jgi:CRP-like cAMP-binding protein
LRIPLDNYQNADWRKRINLPETLFFMEVLISHLHSIARMSPALEAHLRGILKCYVYNKGDMILKEGQVCRHILFLESGLVRVFHRCDEKEVTSWILRNEDFFISVFSFFEQKVSYENIEALEHSVCWGVDGDELQHACKEFPEFNNHQIQILRRYYERMVERTYKLGRRTPEEKYAVLLKEEPDLFLRVPLNILSTYLELPDRTFKRARSNSTPKRGKGSNR